MYSASGGVYGVDVVGTLAYVAAEDRGLVIVDVSNPRNPVFVGSVSTLVGATAVQVVDGYAYVADDQGADQGVVLVDVQDPQHPFIASRYPLPSGAIRRAVAGNSVYAVDGGSLYILRVVEQNQRMYLPLIQK